MSDLSKHVEMMLKGKTEFGIFCLCLCNAKIKPVATIAFNGFKNISFTQKSSCKGKRNEGSL